MSWIKVIEFFFCLFVFGGGGSDFGGGGDGGRYESIGFIFLKFCIDKYIFEFFNREYVIRYY